MIARKKLVEKLLVLNRKEEAEYVKKLTEEEYATLTKEMVAYAMAKEESKKVVMEEVGVGLDALSDKYTRGEVLSAVASLTKIMLSNPLIKGESLEEKMKFLEEGNALMNGLAYIKEKMNGNTIKN